MQRKVSAREDSILFLSDSADKEAKTLSNFCEIEGIINTSLPVPDAILAEVLRHVAGFEDEKDRKKAGQSVLVQGTGCGNRGFHRRRDSMVRQQQRAVHIDCNQFNSHEIPG